MALSDTDLDFKRVWQDVIPKHLLEQARSQPILNKTLDVNGVHKVIPIAPYTTIESGIKRLKDAGTFAISEKVDEFALSRINLDMPRMIGEIAEKHIETLKRQVNPNCLKCPSISLQTHMGFSYSSMTKSFVSVTSCNPNSVCPDKHFTIEPLSSAEIQSQTNWHEMMRVKQEEADALKELEDNLHVLNKDFGSW